MFSAHHAVGVINIVIPTLIGNDSITLTSYGVQNDVEGSITVRQVSGFEIMTPVIFPCYVVCMTTVSVDGGAKAGYPTQLDIDLQVQYPSYFSVGDYVVISMPGFRRSQFEPDKFSTNSFDYTWIPSASSLKIVSKFNSPTTSVKIPILRVHDIYSPAFGIRGDAESFKFNYSSKIGGNITNVPIKFPPIGYATFTELDVMPKAINSKVSLTISFNFADFVQAGELIYIGLPAFVVPFHQLSLDSSYANDNFTVYGNPALYGDTGEMAHYAYLHITCKYILNRNQLYTVHIPESAGISTNSNGMTLKNNIPDIAVVSETSPIASVYFQKFSLFGGISDSKANFDFNNSTGLFTISLYFEFDCKLNNDSKVIMQFPAISGVSRKHFVRWLYNDQELKTIGVWYSNSSTLIAPTPNIILEGSVRLSISSRNLTYGDSFTIAHDSRNVFSIESSTCPTDSVSFLASDPIVFGNFGLSFTVPVINSVTGIDLLILPATNMTVGTRFYINLPDFKLKDLNTSTMLHRRDLAGPSVVEFNNSYSIYYKANGVFTLELTVKKSLVSGVSYSITIPSTANVVVPSSGLLLPSPVSLNVTIAERKLFGAVHSVESVGYFIYKSIVLSNPVAGKVSGLEINFKLPVRILYGETVTFYLPGFSSKNSEILLSGTWHTQFSAKWSSSLATITFKALADISSLTDIVLLISTVNEFVVPANGIAYPNTLFLASAAASEGIIQPVLLDSITVSPYISQSSIQFIGSDSQDAFETEGAYTQFELNPGHNFNEVDVGSQVMLQDKFYTITSLSGNLMTVLEPFSGIAIIGGVPNNTLYSPNIRPAIHLRGNNSKIVYFRYYVRRQDIGTSLRKAIPSPNNYLGLTLEGNVFRKSLIPSLLVKQTGLWDVLQNNLTIDPTIPVVEKNISTTTLPGFYGLNDLIDFHVEFSREVTITSGVNSSLPVLLLNVGKDVPVIAHYSSGNNTNILSFVYQIKGFDFLVNAFKVFFVPIVGLAYPLHAIQSNFLGYIRRTAIQPTIDVDNEILSYYRYGVSENITLDGASPKVVALWSNQDTSKRYSSGDFIDVYVVFSNDVFVSFFGSQYPTLLLDVGSTTPGVAVYFNSYNTTTLTFRYFVRITDAVNGSLYLHCDCQDYFKRTYIHLGESYVVKASSPQIHSSVILAKDDEATSRYIDGSIYIENVPPTIVQIYSNLTSGIYPPGTIGSVFVEFTDAVIVWGFPRLKLASSLSYCYARYYAGSTTTILQFLYLFGSNSGTNKMACDSIDSFDLSNGLVRRFSGDPVIDADLRILDSASNTVNQIVSTISVNPLVTVPVLAYRTTPKPATSSNNFYLTRTMDESVFVYSSYENEFEATNVLLNNSTLQSLIPLIGDSSDQVELYNDGNITTYLYATSSNIPYSFVRPWLNDVSSSIIKSYREWWTAYSIGTIFDINVNFSNPVNAIGSFLQLNTGSYMNKAFAVSSGNIWYISISKSVSYSFGLQYQLEYGGQITRCIGVEAATYGAISSLQALLFELPLLKKIGVTVNLVEDTSSVRIYKINFLYPGEFPLNLYFEDPSGLCPTPAGPSIVSISTGVTDTYRYYVKSHASIVLRVTSVIPVGSHELEISPENGISVSPWGIHENAMTLELSDNNENLLYRRAMDSTGVLRSSYSSLYFSSTIPGDATDVNVIICLEKKITRGDTFSVYLTNFTGIDRFSYVSDSNSNVMWNSSVDQLTFEFLDNSNFSNCLVENVGSRHGLTLPRMIVTQSSYTYTFSVTTSVGLIDHSEFQLQSSIGFSTSSMTVFNKMPGFNTSFVISFDLLCPITNDSIVITLPLFTKTSVTLMNISLTGPFMHVMPIGIWYPDSSQLWILPNATLSPGHYSIFIDSREGLTVPPDGIKASLPPSLTMTQSSYIVPPTVFSSFPLILAFKEAYLRLSVERPSNILNSISFGAIFGDAAYGNSMNISIYLPCLSSTLNYLSWDMGSGDHVFWDGSNNSLVYFAPYGLPSGGEIHFNLRDVEQLFVNEIGVPSIVASPHYSLNKVSTGVWVSAVSLNGGTLDSWPLINVTVVPIIAYSRLSILKAGEINIQVELNLPMFLNDTLILMLPSYSGIENVTVVGDCADSATVVSFVASSVIKMKLNKNCKQGMQRIDWNISNAFKRPIISTRINQFNSESNSFIGWDNDYLNTGMIPISVTPIIGFSSSALFFGIPTAGYVSNMTFKGLLITDLGAGDSITLILPGFSFPFHKKSIIGNIGRAWNIEWYEITDYITFQF